MSIDEAKQILNALEKDNSDIEGAIDKLTQWDNDVRSKNKNYGVNIPEAIRTLQVYMKERASEAKSKIDKTF